MTLPKMNVETLLKESRLLSMRLQSRRDNLYARGYAEQFKKADRILKKAQARHLRRANAVYDPLIAMMVDSV
jgi:hypothetical protein